MKINWDIIINEAGGTIKFKNQAGKPPKDVPFTFDGTNIVSNIDSDLKNKERQFEDLLTKSRINLIENAASLVAYANAVATYEKVVIEGNKVIGSGEYGEIYSGGNLAADAQRQIYEIYEKLGFVEKQIDAGRKLLDDFVDVKDRELINEELKALGDRSKVAGKTFNLL